MVTFKQLRQTDNEYYHIQTTVSEKNGFTVFNDKQLTDMYDHNYLLVTEIEGMEDNIKEYITKEIAYIKSVQDGHVNAVFAPTNIVSEELDIWLQNNGLEKSIRIYMAIPVEEIKGIALNETCIVKRAMNKDMIHDGVTVIEEDDLPYTGAGFAKRKALRKASIYEQGEVKLYVCYVDGNPVGAGEWFKNGDLVKIESLVISEEHQRKGYGSQLIRKMMADASAEGAKYVYLTTDKDDTPQQMYRKLGFELIGEESRYFWKIG